VNSTEMGSNRNEVGKLADQFREISLRTSQDFRTLAERSGRNRNQTQSTLTRGRASGLDRTKLNRLDNMEPTSSRKGNNDPFDTSRSRTRRQSDKGAKRYKSTFSQFYLDDRVKDMISIASLDDHMGPNGVISDEVCEVTVHETSTQANSLIDRLQN
jgi:hypothetical protein